MENKNLQQSLLDANAKAINVTKSYLEQNRYMISGLVNTLKSINTKFQPHNSKAKLCT